MRRKKEMRALIEKRQVDFVAWYRAAEGWAAHPPRQFVNWSELPRLPEGVVTGHQLSKTTLRIPLAFQDRKQRFLLEIATNLYGMAHTFYESAIRLEYAPVGDTHCLGIVKQCGQHLAIYWFCLSIEGNLVQVDSRYSAFNAVHSLPEIGSVLVDDSFRRMVSRHLQVYSGSIWWQFFVVGWWLVCACLTLILLIALSVLCFLPHKAIKQGNSSELVVFLVALSMFSVKFLRETLSGEFFIGKEEQEAFELQLEQSLLFEYFFAVICDSDSLAKVVGGNQDHQIFLDRMGLLLRHIQSLVEAEASR